MMLLGEAIGVKKIKLTNDCIATLYIFLELQTKPKKL